MPVVSARPNSICHNFTIKDIDIATQKSFCNDVLSSIKSTRHHGHQHVKQRNPEPSLKKSGNISLQSCVKRVKPAQIIMAWNPV
jgi:hypothetical protein